VRPRAWLTHLAFPGILVLAILVATLSYALVPSYGLATAVTMVLVTAVVGILERIHPASAAWGVTRADLGADALHAVVSNALPSWLLELALKAALLEAAGRVRASGVDLWPDAWPLAAQVFLALLAAEVGFYAVHRFFHECKIPWIWKWHAVHHSITRMYFLAGARTHPVQVLISFGATVAILWFLGAPDQVIFYKTVVHTANGILQHCNVEIRGGLWNWIFSGPELHRWHHARRVEDSDHNYGNNLILVDLIFGTRYLPGDARGPLGLPSHVRYPAGFLGHFLLPFRWRRATRGPAPADRPRRRRRSDRSRGGSSPGPARRARRAS
jgi:sterol desaturase/sphingolipid hydroxylase (fatty acid hydroxylase superfamily)